MPIQIELSELQARAYRLAGTAPDENVKAQIVTVLVVGGMDGESADFMAQKLTVAALEARAKIEAATAFEIVIAEETPPVTQPSKKEKKSTKSKS